MASPAKLYVIPGSHACRTAMLALDMKEVPFRTVELPTGAHSLAVRLLGFPGNAKPIRSVEGHTHASLAALDRLGTVPALRYEDRRIQTNREIIGFLEKLRPQPPLFPADPRRREAVEEARLWGDETLQMAARRAVLGAGGLDKIHERGARGRLGALLARRGPVRVVSNEIAGRAIFKAHGDEGLVSSLGPLLDRVDDWITDGTLNGQDLNAADITIAPSLALLDYRLDLREDLRRRPSYSLLERLLPEPA